MAKTRNALFIFAFALTVAAGACAAVANLAENAVKTPAQSKLFDRHVDLRSGVVSYILKPGLLKFHQQSLYFTAKSMTDDGRFIVLDVAPVRRANGVFSSLPIRKPLAPAMFRAASPSA